MENHQNITEAFEHIIKTLQKVEQTSELFSQLKNITAELSFIKQYVMKSIETLNHQYNSFIKGTELLSSLVEFQKNIIQCKEPDDLVSNLFSFLKGNLPFDEAFIAFRREQDKNDYAIISSPINSSAEYKEFINKNAGILQKFLLDNNQLSYVVSDTSDDEFSFIDWRNLSVTSAIFFLLRVHDQFIGMGVLIRKKNSFELKDLSFINLILGFISLLIYQNYYLSWVKSRLLEQSQVLKVLDEVKYNDFFEKGPYYLFSLDTQNIVIHANSAGENNGLFNYNDLIGNDFLEIIPRAFHSGLKRVINSVQIGKISTYRSPLISKNGKNLMMEFLMSRIEIKDRDNIVLVLAVDITENYIKDMMDKRNEMLDEIDQFSRILVSQFNNLLTTIIPNITLLRNNMSPQDPNQPQLEIIEKAAKRSANLVQKFLYYDVDEGETHEITNLNKIISSFIQGYDKFKSHNIKVQLDLDPLLKGLKILPLRIRKLLGILLDNSVLALQGKADPKIHISTTLLRQQIDGLIENRQYYLKAGNYIELSVFDNGCGIPERGLSQVFKPFYSTRVKNEGVGLELFMAYNILKDMKGQIFIDSEVDKYTKVSVFLPFKEEKDLSPVNLHEQRMYKTPSIKQPTVLVVDDEYNIRSMMKEIMEMSGLKVFTAGNGRDGLDVYQRHKKDIDLIIMDIVMPIMDGRAAFNEIRKINPNQKVFIISGYSQREDLEDMLEKGAIGFMRKPFQVKEIVDKVKDILNIKN